MEKEYKDIYAEIEDIIMTLNFDPALKKRLLVFFATLKTQNYDALDIKEVSKQAKVRSILHTAYEGVKEVRKLEKLYGLVILGVIPPFMSYQGVFALLREDLPERFEQYGQTVETVRKMKQEITRDTEEELEKEPDGFSIDIIAFAELKLKKLLAGE
jgi:hypothetical protein